MTDTTPLQRKLHNWQMLLLDLTRSNRLLYFKPERGSSVPITSPAAIDLFHDLVVQGKKLTFPTADEAVVFEEEPEEPPSTPPLRGSAQDADVPPTASAEGAMPEPSRGKALPTDSQPTQATSVASDPPVDQSQQPSLRGSSSATKQSPASDETASPTTLAATGAKPNNHTLTSSLSETQLTRALYNLRARARTAAEEQGVNVLFVAFGLLHWIDPETKEEAQSPVVLVPVKLEKERGRDAYSIELIEDDLLLNPTLAYKLSTDFNLNLPPLPVTLEEAGVAAYVDQVRALVAGRAGWSLTSDAILGVFSFQKINLYQDLADNQALYAAHPVIAALGSGTPLPPPPQTILAADLDARVPPSNSFQVVDADASQQEAIEAVKAGASFVMQGPPGTGKSQTITNIIAECLATGKHVLFVSQKMAALEVVQHRLNQAGLGALCLQLHSHKRDKREVVQELIDSLDAPEVQLKPEYQTTLLELEETRRKLNAYVAALHTPRFALHQTVFHAYGELARLNGTPTVHFDVGDVTSVAASLFSRRMQLLDQFEALPDIIDRFQQHPWRGVALRSVSFAQREQLSQALAELIDLLPQYADRMRSLAALCALRAPQNLTEAAALLDLLKDNDPKLFTLDLEGLDQRFEHDYDGVLRTLKGSYRAELKELDQINKPDDKLDYDEAVALLKQARAVKQMLAREATHPSTTPPGGSAQDDRVTDVRSYVAGTFAVRAQIDRAVATLKSVFGDEGPVINQNPMTSADFAAWSGWLTLRQQSLDQLEPYTALLRLSDEGNDEGLGSFGKAALAAQLPAHRWKDAYQLGFWQAFVDAAAQADEVLRSFDSHSRAALIERFRELDRQQLILNRARIQARMTEQRPAHTWISATTAETAVLRREGAKKRRLKPLRKLLAEIPRLITDLKPCLMMSPLSVATLIDPAVFKFDVVVFDEASQIAPEEAAGAIMRGAQVVIAGDTKQLPPTRFFSVIGSDDEDATSEEDGRLFESILDEASGLNLPQKLLRWHYRSRDEELIAFSNHHFYADRLFTFPNVEDNGVGVGVEFVHVPEGVYRRGRAQRRNEVEAERVVDLIFEHAEKLPQQTLGIITFSYAQRDAVIAEWEKRRREQPQFDAFFDENAAEPFFIKNLEMVQGDERDVIFFSVGYGKDEAGKVLLNFGPLNQDGGERRLNVAVTRARYNVKLVSSIMPEDIDLTRTQSQGARLLREYMVYARDGIAASLRGTAGAEAISRNADEIASQKALAMTSSPFEDAVYAALTAQGLTLHRNIGVSSYRIDLAVVDPDQANHYLIGIECDGAMYLSAPTARERDRLRQQVLEQLGWKMHRVWSHDWVANPSAEVEKVMARLKEPAPTQVAQIDATAPDAEPVAKVEPAAAESYLAPAETPEEVKSLPTYVWPYLYAKLPTYTDSLNNAVPHDLVADVVKVVGTEGPVHVDLVYARVGAAYKTARLTAKVKQLINTAIGMAVHDQRIDQRGDFLWPIGLATPIVRAPKEGDEVRTIEHIAPEEISEAAFLCVQEARSLTEADLIRETAKLLGYARVTKKIDAALTSALDGLKAGGRVKEEEGLVRVR
jgi:very-short-patch-repair endonuclease